MIANVHCPPLPLPSFFLFPPLNQRHMHTRTHTRAHARPQVEQLRGVETGIERYFHNVDATAVSLMCGLLNFDPNMRFNAAHALVRCRSKEGCVGDGDGGDGGCCGGGVFGWMDGWMDGWMRGSGRGEDWSRKVVCEVRRVVMVGLNGDGCTHCHFASPAIPCSSHCVCVSACLWL